MKKGFCVFMKISLVLSFLLLVSFAYGATAQDANVNKPQYGETLTIATPVSPVCWDIGEWCWSIGKDMGFNMEHLLMGDLQKGPRGTNQYFFHDAGWIPIEDVRGELLQSWEVKRKSPKIILHLRKGVMWQEKPGVMNARELVADDVVYSINRIKNSPKAIPLYMDYVGKMETPDKYTVVVNMTEWCADWWKGLGLGYVDAIQAPEQEKASGGAGKWENATGTGPFMINEYKDGHSLIYVKNHKYWDSEAINGKKYKLPFVDKVTRMIIKDEPTRIATFRTGKLDILREISWQQVDGLKKSNPQLKWGRALYTSNFTMAFRMDKKPFNDIRVRQALNMAVNKKEIIDKFFGGNAEMHTYPFPSSFKSVYTPIDKLPPSARALYSYNPEKAKMLLTEAGYPNGFTFKAQIANNRQYQVEVAEMVAAYLNRIGVKMELQPMDYSLWLSVMVKKNHSEGIFYSTDPGSPFTGIRKNFVTGQTWNPHMMADPYLDKTWDDATTNPNLTYEQSMEVMKKLAVYALEQAPALILPTPYVYTAWWPWVKNFYGEDFVGPQRDGPIYARIWIEQEMKKKMGY